MYLKPFSDQPLALRLTWLICFLCTTGVVIGQSKKTYWQQEVKYKMDIRMDVNTHQFTGKQTIRYSNNSPDALDKVFFHLYFNAFQPGSAMDVRSRTIPDPDSRIADRIFHLEPHEIGYQRIKSLTQNGTPLSFDTNGTILEVTLARPIRPGQKVTFVMEYEAQVPIQIRRSGRDNKEGISYSMSQWYPKLCEYDKDGWHANPYIAREFYGVWGEYDVNITIDARYTIGATGTLTNATEIGHGYTDKAVTPKPGMLTWKFSADNVHDFVWAADPDYVHEFLSGRNNKSGVDIHTFYQPDSAFTNNWKALPHIMDEAFVFINKHFGKYPYPSYSFIQGGDGGMEYPMATLITGKRSLVSLTGVSVHELMHSWYQMILGFDESHFSWMDEGFASYAETQVMDHLRSLGLIPGERANHLYEQALRGYKNLVISGREEPLSTHADHFDYNSAYNVAAYTKGEVFLFQLEHIIGKEKVQEGLLQFFVTWKFKHPTDRDFIRVMERVSGMELDWYREYMVNSVKTIDYAVDSLIGDGDRTIAQLTRYGKMPMPVDLLVTLKSGKQIQYTLPLDIMRGHKTKATKAGVELMLLPDWDWVNPYYDVELPYPFDSIESIVLDPYHGTADMNRENDQWPPVKS